MVQKQVPVYNYDVVQLGLGELDFLARNSLHEKECIGVISVDKTAQLSSRCRCLIHCISCIFVMLESLCIGENAAKC